MSYRARWTETSPEPQTETLQVHPFDAEAESDYEAPPRYAYEPDGPEPAPAQPAAAGAASGGFRDRIARALQSFDPRRPGHPSLEPGAQPAEPDQAPSPEPHQEQEQVYEPHEVVAAVSPRVEDSRFPIGPIGYNRAAVDERIAELERELEELHASTEEPISITDEIERLGEQTASILVVAHDEAHETTRAAREHADRTIADAAASAAAMTANAKRKLADLDNETDAVWRERARLLDDARDVGLALIALSEEALERFPEEAKTGEVAAQAASSSDESAEEAPRAASSPEDETVEVGAVSGASQGKHVGWSADETGELPDA